jgi:hypothetical protein
METDENVSVIDQQHIIIKKLQLKLIQELDKPNPNWTDIEKLNNLTNGAKFPFLAYREG